MTADNYLSSKRVDAITLEACFVGGCFCVFKNHVILDIVTHMFTGVKMQLRDLTVTTLVHLLPRFLWEIPSYNHGSGLSQISQTCGSQKLS